MFGYTIIRKDELKEYKRTWMIASKLVQVHRWFSSFKDLDIIWDYVFSNNQKMIEDVRKDYAKARGTTVYNEPLKNKEA